MSKPNGLKFVILGEGRVGKTSILSKYFTKKFVEGQKSTVNPSFYEKKQNFQGKEVNLNFWDTAGQEQFNAINTMYYQNAVGALLVYDVTIPETFEKVKSWVNTLQEAVGKDIIFVIAGNKFDLSDKNMITKNNEQVDNLKNQLYTMLPIMLKKGWFKVISLDNFAIKQLNVKRLLSKEDWTEFYMGDDGAYTMYVDMVNKVFAKNSCEPLDKRYPLMDTIEEMFNYLKELEG